MKPDDLWAEPGDLISDEEKRAIAQSVSRARVDCSSEEIDEVCRWAARIRFRAKVLEMVIEGNLLPYWDRDARDVKLLRQDGRGGPTLQH